MNGVGGKPTAKSAIKTETLVELVSALGDVITHGREAAQGGLFPASMIGELSMVRTEAQVELKRRHHAEVGS